MFMEKQILPCPIRRLWRAAIALMALPALSAHGQDKPAASATPPTIADLAAPRFLGGVSLSRDGRHLGAILSDENRAHYLTILDLATGTSEHLKAEDKLDIYSFRWLNNQEILFNVSKEQRYAYGLYRAELGKLASHTAINMIDLTRILGVPEARPDRALIHIVQSGLNPFAEGRVAEISTLHNAKPSARRAVTSFEHKAYPRPEGGVASAWYALPNGELGFAVTYRDLQERLHRYEPANDRWLPVELDLETHAIVAIDPDNHSLWVSQHTSDRGFTLRKFDPVTRVFSEPFWQDPTYDLGTARLDFSPRTKQLAGITYHQRRQFSKWFAEPFASTHAMLQARYPDADVRLLDYDDSEQKFLYQLTGPTEPVRTLLVDLQKKEILPVSTSAPALRGRSLRPSLPVSYQTRDGLRLEGYLTLPAVADARHKVPLVILPHGNWWDRDCYEFDTTVQFLASLGYAVLQPNYRGSSGYAPSISKHDRYDFRRKHEDVTDAVRAIGKLDMIDSSRVAIMGTNLGAYLALCGVAFEPGLYRCAVVDDGIYDWQKFAIQATWRGQYGREDELRDRLREADPNLEKMSPVHQVAAIQAPVFISHDKSDKGLGQSARLKAAMKKYERSHEVFTTDSSLRGSAATERYEEYLRQVAAFLKKHL